MQFGPSPLSPYLSWMAALCFAVSGLATNHKVSQAFVLACVLLAVLSVLLTVRFVDAPWRERKRGE